MGARTVEDAPHAVLATAKELLAKGLVEGTSCNVSARMPDGNICITPSSVDYRAMAPEDSVVIDPTGEVVEGTRSPSSEKSLHLACYEAGAMKLGGSVRLPDKVNRDFKGVYRYLRSN